MNQKLFFKIVHPSFRGENKRRVLVHALKYMLLCFFIFIYHFGYTQNKKEAEIILGTFDIHAGDRDRYDIPIRFECKSTDLFGDPSNLRKPNSFYYIDSGADLALLRDHHIMLYEEGGKKARIPAQWEPKVDFNWETATGQGALVWLLDGKTPKGSSRKFRLVLKQGLLASGPFSVKDINSKSLLIKRGAQSVLQYNYGIINQVEGQTNPHDKSSYIHPVWTPNGKIVTGDFSPEHIWQRGLYLAWEKAKFGDIETNFWELGDNTGRTLIDDLMGPTVIEGPVFAEIVVHNKGTVSGKTRFKEICVVRLYNQSNKDIWIFDLFFRQVPVDPNNPNQSPKEIQKMELPKVYYGGMAFRGVSPEWLHRDFIARDEKQLLKFKNDTKWLPPDVSLDILTSEGYDRKSSNGTPARWIDYTGPLGDEWGGLVMFDHPSNQRYPTPLRVHPDMPYFCYAFAKNEPYTITSEVPLNLTYRVYVHSRHPNKEVNEQIASDFVNPPKVVWQRGK